MQRYWDADVPDFVQRQVFMIHLHDTVDKWRTRYMTGNYVMGIATPLLNKLMAIFNKYPKFQNSTVYQDDLKRMVYKLTIFEIDNTLYPTRLLDEETQFCRGVYDLLVKVH